MTKPRKEQVRNLKTNYGTILSNDWAGTEFGQNYVGLQNDTVNSNFAYTDFMDQTLTGVAEGADQNSPACIVSLLGLFGPWALSSGNSFTIRMSGLNSNSPMSVTLQSGDFTTIGGNSRLTTFALVDRINAVTTAAGAPVPAATADRGRIMIRSVSVSGYDVGATASMTITDVTPGILSTLGLSTGTSLTVYGKFASTRGLVTSSPDGLGGYVELRTPEGGPVYPDTVTLERDIRAAGIVHVTREPADVPAFARIRYFPGPLDDGRKLEISTWRQYTDKPRLILRRPNISALTGTDAVTFTLRDAPSFGNTVVSFTVNFSAFVNPTMQTIVDHINTAFGQASVYTNFRSSCVQLPRGPYSFPEATGFRFGNGFSTLVTVNFAAGEFLTESQMATKLNDAITAASFNAVLTADINTNGIQLRAIQFSQELYIRPLINGNTRALEVLGLTTGSVRGVNFAFLYGNDAIELVNPIRNAQFTWTTNSTTATRLGISTSGNAVSTLGMVPTLNTESVSRDLSIPESMEFWEVPDDIESDNRQFIQEIRTTDTTTIDTWTRAAGISPILNAGLKIDRKFLPTTYSALKLSQVQFLPTAAQQAVSWTVPSIIENHAGYEALWNLNRQSVVDTNGYIDTGSVRTYTASERVIITFNAAYNNTTTQYTSDSEETEFSHMWSIRAGTVRYRGKDAAFTPWDDNDWDYEELTVDNAVNLYSYLKVGSYISLPSGISPTLNLDRPRIYQERRQDNNTPSGNTKYTCLFESPLNGAGAALPLRIYLSHSVTANFTETSINGFVFTVNAKWNQGTGLWSRDVTSDFGTAWVISHKIATDINATAQGRQGFGLLRSPNTNTWSDTAWNKTGFYSTEQSLNGDYSTMSLFGSPTISMGPTSVSASNTILSWGRVFYGATPSIASNALGPTDIAFNVSGVARTSAGIYTTSYSTPVGDFSTVIMGSTSNVANTYYQSSAHTTNNFTVVKIVSGSQSDGGSNSGGSHITVGQLRSGYIYP